MSEKKRVTHRMLTRLEAEILQFLWKWKLGNAETIRRHLAPERGIWKFYKILRRLFKEGYTKEVSDPVLNIPLWTLAKKGFLAVSETLGCLEQDRYQPQAVAHDYLASAFQLGDFVFGVPVNVELVSEQEINATELELLPIWLPKSKEHIPDGYTLMRNGKDQLVFAIEVELNAKPQSRYGEMIEFLDRHREIDLVFWLCATELLIERITQKVLSVERRRAGIHNFMLLEHLKRQGWDCPILWGNNAGSTVRQVMGQNPSQSPVRSTSKNDQPPATSILFSTAKSPKKMKLCAKS